MDETEFTASNFMPRDLIEIICILERGEKSLSVICIKLYKRGIILLSALNFPPRMENQRQFPCKY